MITWREDVTCWAPEHADHLIPVEAEALPDDLFQATHVPLRLRRVSATNPATSEGEAVSEDDVLDELFRRLKPEARETDVFPILGASGAGKSHLVRWLRNELGARGDLDDVRFVFVPKHRTSLRGVITSILSAFEDVDEVAELRERLLAARDEGISEEELRARVRDALCNGLEYRWDRTEVADNSEEQARSYLAESLATILRDPHFAPRYLDDGSAIARLVEEKRSGRRGDDALDHAFRFTAVDVAVSVDDVSHAAKTSQEVANALASDPPVSENTSLRELAAQMLNDQLPGAIKEVFGIGGEDLRELFVEVRRILRGRQDIVLLVEDFAMFQGLQAGLVDAITLASSVSEELCHLITVVAVTTGYYNDEIPDTLKTRASTAFVVDEQGPDAPAEFATRYLRAMRLRTSGRDTANHSLRSCEGCPVLTDCHESFGDVDGEGLFPFNRVLLHRGVETRLDGTFNARRFLTQVLRPVLVEEYEAIRAQEHPSEGLAEYFDARQFSPAGDALMRLRTRDQGERRVRLALLYKDPVNEGDLLAPVHAAFDLPPLGVVASPVLCAEPGCDLPASDGAFCADHADGPIIIPPTDEPPLVRAIDSWKRGGSIAQRDRTRLRQLVTQAVASRIDFADGAYRASAWGHNAKPHPRLDTSGQARSIVLDGNRQASTGWVELELNSSDAETIDAFQSLAWLDAKRSWRDVPNGVERAGRLERMLMAWAVEVESQLGLRTKVDEELVAAALGLEVLAGLAGHGLVPKRHADRLVRLRNDTTLPGVRWSTADGLAEKLAGERATFRELLDRRLAFAQGAGAPVAYDALAVKKLFERMRDEGLTYDGGKSPVSMAVKNLLQRLGDTESWGKELLGELPDVSVLGGDAPEEILRELEKVARRGPVSADLRKAARDAARAVVDGDIPAVERARAELLKWDDLSIAERAALAGGAWFGAAQRVKTFIDRASEVLDAATPADVALDVSARSAVESEWSAALDELERSATELRKAFR